MDKIFRESDNVVFVEFSEGVQYCWWNKSGDHHRLDGDKTL